MSAPARHPAPVHLHVQGRTEDDAAELRQQLAVCLSHGVTHIQVHVEDAADLAPPVLRALHGVADYLGRRGGGLRVVGAPVRPLGVVADRGSSTLRTVPGPAGGPARAEQP